MAIVNISTIADISQNNTLTPIGTVSNDSFTPFRPANWSTSFSGSGSYLTVPADQAFQFGTGDFTIEAWIRLNSFLDARVILTHGWPGINAPFLIYTDTTTNRVSFYASSTGSGWNIANQVSIINAPAINTWYHIAITRNGSTFRTFCNGVQTNTFTNTSSFYTPASNVNVTIGNSITMAHGINGYISNLRIVKGTAVYTSNFTPSTSPLTAVSGTSLLTCQSATIVDSSPMAFSISKFGNTAVRYIGPFPEPAYNANSHASAISISSLGSYISTYSSDLFTFGSSNFTIECWVYPTGINSTAGSTIISRSNLSGIGPFLIGFNSSGFLQALSSSNGTTFDISCVSTISFNTLSNQWTHIAYTRNANSFLLFVNGKLVTSATNTNSVFSNSQNVLIGFNNVANTFFSGFLSSLHIMKGIALYTTNFSVPSVRSAVNTNTVLLIDSFSMPLNDALSIEPQNMLTNELVAYNSTNLVSKKIEQDTDYEVIASINIDSFAIQNVSESLNNEDYKWKRELWHTQD